MPIADGRWRQKICKNLGLERYFGRLFDSLPIRARLSVFGHLIAATSQTCHHHDGSRGICIRKKRRPASKAFDHRNADEGKETHVWHRPGVGYM
jgi:hypothetical protein